MIAALCFSAFSTRLAAVEPPMIIKYPFILSQPKAPQAYKYDLVKLILDQTVAEYGAYRLEMPELNALGGKRQAQMLNDGKQVNLLWLPPSTMMANIHATAIRVDILRGLLGYRVCLINNKSKTDFDKVVDIKTFSGITVGQGLGWADVEIYQFNGVQPILGSTFDGLMGMLATNRFSCLALGANEISETLEEYAARMPMLAIEPGLLVYYDYPIYFYVNDQYPLIAARFELGFKKILANGEFNALFARYHEEKLKKINIRGRRMICLKSPYLPLDKQCLPTGPEGMSVIQAR